MTNTSKVSRRMLLGTTAAAAVAAPLVGYHTSAAAETTTGSVLKVSSLGYDLQDSTQFLQAALDSTASTVIIDYVPGGWTTKPLFLRRSNVKVIVEPDVMVRSLTGAYADLSSCLLTIADQTNVTVSGYGASFVMNKPEYKTGEWRMAIKLQSVSNTTIEGLVLRDSGGDGIYVGRGKTPYCTNVTLRDLVCDNHRRQGMSVITVDGLTVEGCAFINTNGTAPQSGVDFEPNAADERLANIILSDCVFYDNMTAGVQLYGGKLRPDTYPVSIRIDRSTIGSQIGGSPQIMISSAAGVFPGSIEIRDSLVDVSTGSSALGMLGNEPGSINTIFNRSVAWNWGNAFQFYSPIVFLSRGHAKYGNLTVNDSVVVTDQPGPYLSVDGLAGTTLHNVHGDISVVNPSGAEANFGPNPQDVDLTTNAKSATNKATVTVRAIAETVTGGTNAALQFTRSGGDMTLPLAIAYSTSGSARERYDYGGLGKVAVIPPTARQVTVPVRTFPRHRSSDPRFRNLTATITAGQLYEALPHSTQILIKD